MPPHAEPAPRPAPASDFSAFSAEALLAGLPELHEADRGWREALTRLLERCYRLSLYTDEGRPLRFALAVSRGETLLPSEEFLAPPLEASLSNLRRLCVATDPRASCLHVSIDGDDGSARSTLRGICARPELTDHPHGDQLFLVDVLDPACVALRGRLGEVRHERDAICVPDGRDVLGHAIPEVCVHAIEKALVPNVAGDSVLLPNGVALAPDAYRQHGARLSARVSEAARATLAEGLVLLIEEIRRLAHGGTVVLAPDAAPLLARASDAQRFERRRGLTAEPWNRGMIDHLAWLACRNLALSGLGMVSGVTARGGDLRDWAVDVAHARCEQALAQWRADARRCAWLTQVDGAVVIDSLLEPRALGLKITLDNLERLPASWRSFLEGRGMRHRAAACMADTLDTALVFAVSQDGGVTLFVKSPTGSLAQTMTL